MKYRNRSFKTLLFRFPFFLIFFCTTVLYSAILLTSQSHVDGDESVVGIMARHIITRGERPVFFYGQAYGGGAALEAYLAVIPFTLFGESSISLKLVALCLSLATIALTYIFCLRYCTKGTALVATALLALVTPLVEWHTKMRGGYAGFLLSYILILLLYARIVYDHKKHFLNFIVLGLICGLAYYNKALILSLLAVLFITSACWRKIFWRMKSIIAFAMGFVIGSAPLIQYELAHNFENTRFVLGLGSSGDKSPLLNGIKLLTEYLPAFYTGRNLDMYVVNPPLRAWIEYLIYAVLFCYVLYTNRKSIRMILTAWISRKLSINDQNQPKPEALVVLSVIFHLAVCTFSKETALSPRYLVPLFPALTILAGSAIESMWQKGSKYLSPIAIVTFIVLISLGLITHVSYIRPSTVNDDVLLSNGQIVNLQTSGEAVTALIDFLRQQNISYVRCAYFLQWRIIFESQETIIASSNGFVPGFSRFREYDKRVDQAENVAFLYHKDATLLQDFLKTETAMHMNQKQIYEFVVFYPSSD